ncbi:MAG: hypothetical protein ACWA6U_07055 [Breznakibacter sp.]
MKFFCLLIVMATMACGLKRNNDAEHSARADSLKLLSTDETVSRSEEDEHLDSIDFEALGYELMNSETIGPFCVGLEVAKLIENLGQPGTKMERIMWPGDGEYHQTLVYPDQGLEFDMIGETDQMQTVNAISMNAPCKFKTSKGVGIGSCYNHVVQIYKDYVNPSFSSTDVLVAGSLYGGVIFNFEGGVLQAVFIGAQAE